jgi:hypothetical protein
MIEVKSKGKKRIRIRIRIICGARSARILERVKRSVDRTTCEIGGVRTRVQRCWD